MRTTVRVGLVDAVRVALLSEELLTTAPPMLL